ncbi:endo-alpha-N-acetylgalactosaminidase [Paenibacillus castaneae]|uniref:endo-alpha-N-acetylgalactosaminidase family protein n=1 Tax=Paenibacillus castaneae TaxID=474957 RepID=UPI000C9B617C|nr:endo-alpha-N-acetylgalactosaminidase family protein [Paenibacillus castaneae]NIK78717.1 endo-alpha-N-acetylgalactosaminidase [Paenibacillus castaneae]
MKKHRISLKRSSVLFLTGALLFSQLVGTYGSNSVNAATFTSTSIPFEYKNDFTSGITDINKISGSGTVSAENNSLRITGKTQVLVGNAPIIDNGEVEFTLEPMNGNGGFGLVFRGDQANNWSALECVTVRSEWNFALWKIKNSTGLDKYVVADTTTELPSRQYKIKVRYVGKVITLWIDGQEVTNFETTQLNTNAGQIGFITEDYADVKIDNIVYRNVDSLKPTVSTVENVTLVSDQMSVDLDGAFPRVIEYDYNGKKMYGQLTPNYYAMVNSTNYNASATVTNATNTSVTYRVVVPDITAFDTIYTLNGNALTMEISNIDESQTTIYSLGFPENSMVSVKSSQTGATLNAAVPSRPPGGDGSQDDIKDVVYNLSTPIPGSTYQYANIPIFNTSELAAAINNNVLYNLHEFAYQSFPVGNEYYTGAWSTEFVWRPWGYDNKTTVKPETTVVITDDANADGLVDWQDGALALNDVRGLLPGSEKLSNSFTHIAMNFGSGAQNPFLRILDNLKKFYLYSDGFEQMLEIKGYNSEGHDSGHPVSDDVNTGAGGAEDFETLSKEALKIGADVGAHVNNSNIYPEAETFREEFVSPNGWDSTRDYGYDLKRENYITAGEMDKRFNNLKNLVPNMKFVYLDTYFDDRYNAFRIGSNFKQNNWHVWTENKAQLDKYSTWVHYPGINSTIHRFVHHQDKDVYGYSALLRGGYNRGSDNFMGWGGSTITNSIKQLFSEQLPYRYLMHNELLKMTSTVATFANGVTSKLENGKSNIYKDGKLVASDKLVFIPWSPENEDKIYHWNPTTTKTSTWDLPNSWAGQTSVKLYRLTSTGKQNEVIVPVQNGKITISTEQNTPYVVYKGNNTAAPVQVEEWSTGSPVKDASFISHNFNNWTKVSDKPENISIKDTSIEKTYLEINGAEDGAVTQTMTGLVGGQKYVASVWAEVAENKIATISVKTTDGKEESNYMSSSPIKMNMDNSDKTGSKFMIMSVEFTVPQDQTTAILTLKGTGGTATSLAKFTDVRVTKTDKPDRSGYVAYEDFENVPEGYGIFIRTTVSPNNIHLSETNKPYTMDTLDGKFSLKTLGNDVRTMPYTLRLLPNKTYFLRFLSSAGGTVKVLSDKNTSEVIMNNTIKSGQNAFTFITGNADDYYVLLAGTQVIDNFTVITNDQPMNISGITTLAPIAGVAMKSAKTAAALGLPGQIALETDLGSIGANVTWDLSTADYDPNASKAQTFMVKGTVILPNNVLNPNNIPLTTSITVSVNKIPQSQMTATATSQETSGENNSASMAIDGKPNTIWHTKWDKSDPLPQSITLKLGGSYKINQVTYLPRPGGGNGTITAYNIYVSSDGVTFTKVASGNWANDSKEKNATFTATTGSYVKLEATAGQNGWASAAEINVLLNPTTDTHLLSITAPVAITDLANGREKTAEALGLPATVELITDAGSMNTNVAWNVEASSYDPTVKAEQTFTVDGSVTLPEGVDNPNNVPLTTNIQVTVVQGDQEAPMTTDNAPTNWVNEDVTVLLDATDSGTGVASTHYIVNDGEEQTGNSVVFTEEGVHILQYWSVDKVGNVEERHTATVKIDKTGPNLKIELDPTTLWPANHKMLKVNATLDSSDALSGIKSILLTSITSNEPESDEGDIQANLGSEDTSFSLRATRAGKGTGRVYTITYTITDHAGNQTVATATVTVPHDQSGKPGK